MVERSGGQSEVISQAILELVGTEAFFQGAAKGQGDPAGLLGDDYNGGIRFAAEAQSSPMARAEGAGSFVHFGQGELTAGSQDVIAPDDNTHIVESGARPENTHQQFGADAGIEPDAGFGEASELDFTFHGHDGPYLVLGKTGGGPDYVADNVLGFVDRAPEKPGLSDVHEHPAELRLEDDDHGNETWPHELAEEQLYSAPLESLGYKIDYQISHGQEKQGALEEPGSASASQETDNPPYDQADEQELDGDSEQGFIVVDTAEIILDSL